MISEVFFQIIYLIYKANIIPVQIAIHFIKTVINEGVLKELM
jgi:hypothetical protein